MITNQLPTNSLLKAQKGPYFLSKILSWGQEFLQILYSYLFKCFYKCLHVPFHIIPKPPTRVRSLYCSDLFSPLADPLVRSYPGSLKYGFAFKIRPCIESKTWNIVETPGVHFSFFEPTQVFRRLKQTLPL
ncbi:hypothetical protein HanXRQr2_Chr03g0115771 [Helianthus annuus]|uniref:Uncharacterized protein n=1 Tax=Helianthus annuus TaxID=4232 RepID=A0A9K3JGP6_HELAN|nr:hypothetical protein HanXRQr2_Chr03g0115771 [Helianthus annuus]KAJ0944085.1 hypothetical protein HanPSC8_Chr03g0112191 [Helianthus annuus]